MSQTAARPTTAADRANSSTILRAKGVHRSFRMGESTIAILKGVDLNLRQGEFVAIEGRSGSGKSTLLHILGGLDGLDQGTLEFDGESYSYQADRSQLESRRRFSHPGVVLSGVVLASAAPLFMNQSFPHALIQSAAVLSLSLAGFIFWLVRHYIAERPITRLRNSQFGFVFQFYHLLPELNVLENTMLAAMVERSWLGFNSTRRELTGRATQLLNQMGLSHRLKHRPAQLSGGERQRVAIARALMNNPRVLFADEPTGNLDVETGRQIMDVIEKLHRDSAQTIVMVTHDRARAREADRVLVLKDGKLEKAE
jgi:lipoprotein-releasing system ATP-binding protein